MSSRSPKQLINGSTSQFDPYAYKDDYTAAGKKSWSTPSAEASLFQKRS